MKKTKLFSALIIAASLSACSTLSQDMTQASQLKALKSDPAAAKYSKVTARAEKAYLSGNNAMAAKLIEIVQKKVATGSTY